MLRKFAALILIVLLFALVRPLVQTEDVQVAGISAEKITSFPLQARADTKPKHIPAGNAYGLKTTTTTAAGVTTTTAASTTTASPVTTAPATTAATTTVPIVTTTTLLTTTTTVGLTTTTAVGPTTTAVGVPTGAITINAGQNIQQIVNGSPAGSIFFLAAGTHLGQQVAPRDGDQFIGASGAVLSGNGSATYAFRSSAKNVTIRNLVIERYANPAQTGVIQGMGSGWTVESNEIRENTGAGIDFQSGARIIGNNIHHNRQIGLLGHGSNALVENNEIAFNNYLDQYAYGWEAGGTKFIKTTNLVVRGNWVHDNHGPGLWTDHDNIGTVYENNTVTNNHGPGIFHEISYQAVIRNNTVEGNAFPFYVGGILIANSRDVEVYGNTLRNNDGGVVGIEDNRGSGAYGTFQVWNLWVHDNTVSHSNGFTGIANNAGAADVFTGRNNRYDANSYTSSSSKPFAWNNAARTFAEWQNAGNDLNGSFA